MKMLHELVFREIIACQNYYVNMIDSGAPYEIKTVVEGDLYGFLGCRAAGGTLTEFSGTTGVIGTTLIINQTIETNSYTWQSKFEFCYDLVHRKSFVEVRGCIWFETVQSTLGSSSNGNIERFPEILRSSFVVDDVIGRIADRDSKLSEYVIRCLSLQRVHNMFFRESWTVLLSLPFTEADVKMDTNDLFVIFSAWVKLLTDYFVPIRFSKSQNSDESTDDAKTNDFVERGFCTHANGEADIHINSVRWSYRLVVRETFEGRSTICSCGCDMNVTECNLLIPTTQNCPTGIGCARVLQQLDS
ncbi:hypothetical protein Tco_0243160 [Tanacetum coccineum]